VKLSNECRKPKAFTTGLPGPKKFKRPNLAISSFKNPEKMKKRPTKGQISFKNL
jgi:hypothetical protein